MATQKQVELVARLHRECTGKPATTGQKATWSSLDDIHIKAIVEGYTEAIRTGEKE